MKWVAHLNAPKHILTFLLILHKICVPVEWWWGMAGVKDKSDDQLFFRIILSSLTASMPGLIVLEESL